MTLTLLRQNPVYEGGPLGWSNCNTTCTAMLIAFETAGRKRPDGGDVRRCIVNPDGTPDRQGGTSISQNIAAAKACWNVELDHQQMTFERAWTLGQRSDTAVSIAIWYGIVSGTRFDGSPGFRGNHQVILHAGKVYDPLADGRRAGIPSGPQVWPKSLLGNAAGRVNVAPVSQPYRALGAGSALVILGFAPKEAPVKYSVKFEPGAIFVYDYQGGTWIRERDAFSKATSAPCRAPQTIPWPGGRKRVVEITAGRLAGKCVEPGATHVRLVGGAR